jgi:hypothetical protein
MEEDLQALETTKLLELLNNYTAQYGQLMMTGSKDEFDICRYRIIQLQQELNTRKHSENNYLNTRVKT